MRKNVFKKKDVSVLLFLDSGNNCALRKVSDGL